MCTYGQSVDRWSQITCLLSGCHGYGWIRTAIVLSAALEIAQFSQVTMPYVHAVCGTRVVELSQPAMLFSHALCSVGNGRVCHPLCCVYMLFVTQQGIMLCVQVIMLCVQVTRLCVHAVCDTTGDHAACTCCVYR